MTNERTTLTLTVHAGPDVDQELLETFVRQLRDDILQLGVDSVDFPPGPIAPEHAKGSAESLGVLVVVLAASGRALIALINAVQSWISAREHRSVILEIEGDKLTLTGIPGKDRQLIIDAWLSRRIPK